MGCAIHYVIEKKYGDKWVGVYAKSETPHPRTRGEAAKPYEYLSEFERRQVFASRFYTFFAQLAGVRGDGPPALGIPTDASELAQLLIASWDGDGHSHSYLPYFDFCQRYALATAEAFNNDGDVRDLAGLDCIEEFEPYRVVFWFDC